MPNLEEMLTPNALIGPKNTRFNQIFYIEHTNSTNDDLLGEAAKGELGPLVLLAGHQIKGKGRQNRVWHSQPGSALLMSVLLNQPGNLAPFMPYVAGLSLLDFVESAGAAGVGLKWPNDVVTSGGKLAGILVESRVVPSESNVSVVVGMGLNLHKSSNEFPSEVSYESLEALTGQKLDARGIYLEVLTYFETWLATLENQGPSEVVRAYKKRCVTLGKRVEVEILDSRFVGLATDIGPNGSLVLVEDKGLDGDERRVEILAGDAHLLN